MSSHRIQVSLDTDTFSAVQRVSSLTGCSMSSVIANLLNPNLSALQELGDALHKAKELRDGLSVHADDIFRAACEYAADNVINDDAQDLEDVITSPAGLPIRQQTPIPAPKATPCGFEQWEFDEIMKGESHDFM